MSSLDILTPRGQITLMQERRAIAILAHHYGDYHFIPTPKGLPATIDGIVVHSNALFAIAEVKCRTMTLDTFKRQFNSQWLVTYDKIEGGRRLADGMQVQLWGLLYLVSDDVLLCKTLYRPDRGWLTAFGVRKTETRATVNGGIANRDNAYIDMTSAMLLHPPVTAGA